MATRAVRLAWGMRLILLVILACGMWSLQAEEAAEARPRFFGTLQPDPARRAEVIAAGVDTVVMELGWNRWQPQVGTADAAYVAERTARLAELRAAGLQVSLDLGLQYPPGWLFELPHSRYVNQYGSAYVEDAPGKNVPNAVFNQAVREAQAAYVAQVFEALGHEFLLVRLGWGWYSELNYPLSRYGEQRNCYWAFGDLAQGRAAGLPPGVPPCPVPGWRPGEPSPDHDAARRFANWYLDALRDYHDWQIATVRALHPGRLAMLYPSWGLRPGQLDAAIATDLDGSIEAQHNDLSMGQYWPRLIAGIDDPDVVVYSTWLDAPFGDDRSPDPAQWCPMRYLTSLAQPRGLRCAGENTGGNDAEAMARCFQRMNELDLLGIYWAFEPQLFDGDPAHATLADYAAAIAAQRAAGR